MSSVLFLHVGHQLPLVTSFNRIENTCKQTSHSNSTFVSQCNAKRRSDWLTMQSTFFLSFKVRPSYDANERSKQNVQVSTPQCFHLLEHMTHQLPLVMWFNRIENTCKQTSHSNSTFFLALHSGKRSSDLLTMQSTFFLPFKVTPSYDANERSKQKVQVSTPQCSQLLEHMTHHLPLVILFKVIGNTWKQTSHSISTFILS